MLVVEFYSVLWEEHSVQSLIWRPVGGLILALCVLGPPTALNDLMCLQMT